MNIHRSNRHACMHAYINTYIPTHIHWQEHRLHVYTYALSELCSHSGSIDSAVVIPQLKSHYSSQEPPPHPPHPPPSLQPSYWIYVFPIANMGPISNYTTKLIYIDCHPACMWRLSTGKVSPLTLFRLFSHTSVLTVANMCLILHSFIYQYSKLLYLYTLLQHSLWA